MPEVNKIQSEYIKNIYDDMYDMLLDYGISILQNEDDSREAIQNTFLAACRKPNDFMSSPNPKGWIILALKREMFNIIRRNNRDKVRRAIKYISSDENNDDGEENTLDTMPDMENHFLDVEYSDVGNDGDYRLVKMIDVDHYSMAEAAEELGMSLEQCKKRVQRARIRMKSELK